MPELPDVAQYKKYFDKHALRQKVKGVEVLEKRILSSPAASIQKAIEGFSFEKSMRYGKYLLAEISSKKIVAMHFGMTGRRNITRKEKS